jgi:hypothetical protein
MFSSALTLCEQRNEGRRRGPPGPALKQLIQNHHAPDIGEKQTRLNPVRCRLRQARSGGPVDLGKGRN